jgi:hypothetical protein
MLSLITTRIAGWLAGIGGLVLAVFAIYGKGRSDAKSTLKQEATNDATRRTQDAIRAGDAVDSSGSGLRANDGHRRD